MNENADDEEKQPEQPELDSKILTASEITDFIKEKSYLNWKAEPRVHRSSGPHGMVRTFINDTLYNSQQAGNSIHTVGSIAVKELYDPSGRNLTGYAYEKKIKASSDDESWLWYEDLDISTSRVDFYGTDVRVCTGCHSSGDDYVLTRL